jgi:hypothetical protein
LRILVHVLFETQNYEGRYELVLDSVPLLREMLKMRDEEEVGGKN